MSSKHAPKRNTYGNLFSDKERGVVRHLVTEFRRTNRCLKRVYEFEDLEQDCLIYWLKKRGTYDAGKGASLKTYMSRVVKRYLCKLVRHHKTRKRRPVWEALSLEAPLSEAHPDGSSLREIHPSEIAQDLDLEVAELRAAFQAAVAELPDRQRRIVEARLDKVPMTELAKELGVSRDTVYEEIKRIRVSFEKSQLREHIH